MIVGPTTVDDIAAARAWPALAAEYEAEVRNEGLPPPTAKWDQYRHLEALELLHPFSAIIGSELVGFITVLAPVLPKYGIPVAMAESFFVAKAYRMTGAGVKLLAAAEAKARELGSPGLMVTAPIAGKLFEVLPRFGYREISRVFFKRITDA